LLRYPELSSHVVHDSNQIRAGSHTDYGTLTLLFQDSVGGLEVKQNNGEYISAIPIEDSIIVNVGDLLQRWTNDRLRSTIHRVICSEKERFSIAYFCNPDQETLIKSFGLNGEEKKYEDINAYEYLTNRLDSTY
jgi:isopenicillin N synthase-like dioxygenase